MKNFALIERFCHKLPFNSSQETFCPSISSIPFWNLIASKCLILLKSLSKAKNRSFDAL